MLEQDRKKCGNFFFDWKCISSIENRKRCCFYGKSRRFDHASCSIYTSKLIDIQYMRAMWKMCLIPWQMPITFWMEDFLKQEWRIWFAMLWKMMPCTAHIFFIIYLLLHGDSANKNCVKSASEPTTDSE